VFDYSRFLSEFAGHLEVGKGSYGCVFRVERVQDRHVFAVKQISLKARYIYKTLDEIRIMAKLRHPGIVLFHEWWKENPCEENCVNVFILMEFCTQSLDNWLRRHNLAQTPRDDNQIKSWFKQIVSALEYIHSENIFHRDLKPSNILVASHEIVKICDFGIATDCVLENGRTTRTQIGSSLYMAPEQMFYYNEKVDVFSVGLILLELCIAMTDREKTQVFTEIRCAKQMKILQDKPATLDLVKQLTSLDWEARPSFNAIYKHSFF
ncbi:hypothetical protein PENTCL1PPCAC_1003, partial [Pristionchus entomophagus]